MVPQRTGLRARKLEDEVGRKRDRRDRARLRPHPGAEGRAGAGEVGVRRVSGDGEGVQQARGEAILGDLGFAAVGPRRELAKGGRADVDPWLPHSPQDTLFGGESQAEFEEGRGLTTDVTDDTDGRTSGQ